MQGSRKCHSTFLGHRELHPAKGAYVAEQRTSESRKERIARRHREREAVKKKIRQVHLKQRAQSNVQIPGETLSAPEADEQSGTVDLAVLALSSSDFPN